MIRVTLIATFVFALAASTTAWAGEEKTTPCADKQGDELKTCLTEAMTAVPQIALPSCEGKEGDELTQCQELRTAYQKALAEVTGKPCIGFEADELTACEEKQASSKKKKGSLEKHEGTKMERMSGTGDEEE